MTLEQRISIAHDVASTLNARGHSARVWSAGGRVRVYVKSEEGFGAKDYGFVEVLSDGQRNYKGLNRRPAYFRETTEQALRDLAAKTEGES